MNAEELEALSHEVNSKSSSLRSAAALLKKASPDERRELLTLMAQQACKLAQYLVDIERDRGAK